jgi:hypothetical protein
MHVQNKIEATGMAERGRKQFRTKHPNNPARTGSVGLGTRVGSLAALQFA